MSAQTHTYCTEQEYLDLERKSDQKHEFYAGEVVALAGGSAQHNRITINVITNLYNQLQNRSCNVYSSDMRIKIPHSKSYVYPDVSVVCGQEHFDDDSEDTLMNPIVIIEVLSPSTERHDRGKKFEYYRTIESLQEYILIAQDAKRIDHFTRQSTSLWMFSSLGEAEDMLYLTSIDCTITIRAIYHNTAL